VTDRRDAMVDSGSRTLEERVQRLAQEKSFLQLVIELTNRMIAVHDLDALADCILQGLAEVIGGTDLALWYRVDGRFRCHVLSGPPRTLDAPDDAEVAAVFADGRAREREGGFGATRMTTPAFGEARTWIHPLTAGHGLVGVLRVDNLHSGLAGAGPGLNTLFSYIAMALNNAVTGHDRLREANARLGDEVARRRLAEAELRRSHELLEQRVIERTRELQEAKDAVAHSAEAFRCILDTTTAGFWEAGADGRIVTANRAYAELSGYGLDELVGLPISRLEAVEDPVAIARRIERIQQRRFDRFESVHRRKDGSTWDVEVSCSWLEGGTIFAFMRDITERKLAEKERTRELDFIQRVFDSTDAHMAVVARDGTILAVNSAWTRFAFENGCGGGSWGVGASYFRAADPCHGDATGAAEAYAGIRRVQAGEIPSFTVEYPCHHPNRQERWFVLHALPLQGAEGSALVSHQDVTARRQAESDLRQSARILKVTQALAGVGGWEVQFDRDEPYWTDETFRVHGMPVPDDPAEGRDLIASSLACYDEADGPAILEALRRCAEDGEPYDLELPFTPQGGRRGWVRTTAMPVRRDGRIVGVVGTIMDITDRRIHEIERVKMEKLESLGLLAGGIAHDFNNILTAIIGNLSLAQFTIPATHPAHATLAEAEVAATRAGALAHQLLTFSRGGEPVRTTLDLGPLVREAVALLLRGSNVSARVDIEPGLAAVRGDGNQLVQVCNNIVLNAAQAMPGGGQLTVEARNLEPAAAARAGLGERPFVELRFIDQGPGVPDGDLERIFDPYFTTKAAGNGLGLASVHSIVTRHDGAVRVESAPGRGATFRVFLPSLGRTNPVDPSAAKAAPVGADGGGRRLLVMDDEEGIRSLGAAMARRLGWQADTCADGREAVRRYGEALAAGQRYDAVIMDLTVPGGMGGKEAAAAILAVDASAYLIVSSGYSNDPVMADLESCGFRGAVAKPYNLARFGEALAAVVHPGDDPDRSA